MKCTDRPHDTVNGKNMEQERISWLFNCWCKFRRRCQQFDVHIAVEKTTTDDGSGFPFTFFPLSFPSFAQISPERTSSLAMGLRLLLALAPLAALVVGQVGIVIRGSVKVTGRIIFNLRFRWPLLVAVARFAICKRDRVWKGWSSKMRCSFLFITVWSQFVYQANVILDVLLVFFCLFSLFSQTMFRAPACLWGLNCHNSGVFPGSWCLKHVMFFWTKMIVINPMMGRVRNCGDSIFAHYFATICRRCHFRYGKNDGK